MTQNPPHEWTPTRWLSWFLLGVIVALSLQALEARAVGGWDGLARVNQGAAVRPFIEQELGPFMSTARGHDGQFFLALALDPFGRQGAYRTFDDPSYRYRRIAYPLLASGFGLLHGRAVLAGLVLVAALGVGLATASLARIVSLIGARSWVVLAVLGNPGVWFSVQLLTSDALALGLSLTGFMLWIRNRRAWSLLVFAFAVLTKDQYILIPMGLAGWAWATGSRRDAGLLAIASALPVIVWATVLSFTLGGGFAIRGNLSLFGVLESARIWHETSSTDQVAVSLTIAGLLVAALAPLRSDKLVRWVAWPWVVLAFLSSTWVWDLGNNASRVLAPLWVFGLLAVAYPRTRTLPGRHAGG